MRKHGRGNQATSPVEVFKYGWKTERVPTGEKILLIKKEENSPASEYWYTGYREGTGWVHKLTKFDEEYNQVSYIVDSSNQTKDGKYGWTCNCPDQRPRDCKHIVVMRGMECRRRKIKGEDLQNH